MDHDVLSSAGNQKNRDVPLPTTDCADANRQRPFGGFFSQIAAALGGGIIGFFVLLVFLYFGEITRKSLWLPLPGPVIGFAFLATALLATERFLAAGFRHIMQPLAPVARLLLTHMGLLFVPAGVGIINEGAVLRREWLPILAALIGSTILGLAATGWCMHRYLPVEEDEGQ